MRTRHRFSALLVFVMVCALALLDSAAATTQVVNGTQGSTQSGPPGTPGGPGGPGTTNDVSPDLSLRVTSAPGALRAGRPVKWKLEVRNVGKAPITLNFSNSQRGEVLLWGGTQVYDYAAGKAFSPVTAQVTLKPKAHQAFTVAEARLPLSAGTYQLIAGLTSSPGPAPVNLTVTVRR